MNVRVQSALAWLNKARNVVFHAFYGAIGMAALIADQFKLIDWSTISAAKAGLIAAGVSIVSIVLHFTDDRIHTITQTMTTTAPTVPASPVPTVTEVK